VNLCCLSAAYNWIFLVKIGMSSTVVLESNWVLLPVVYDLHVYGFHEIAQKGDVMG